MDGEGFSVNIPWNCGGVGDKDYIFAFQHVVIPIGHFLTFSLFVDSLHEHMDENFKVLAFFWIHGFNSRS